MADIKQRKTERPEKAAVKTKPAGVLDLRSEAELERRRERARALAKQALGMQVARSGGRVEAKPAADGLTRQERAAQRQAAARLEHSDKTDLEPRPVLAAPPVRQFGGTHKSDLAPKSDLGGSSDLAAVAEPLTPEATEAIKRPAAATRPDGAHKKRIGRKVLGFIQYPLIAVVALAAAYSSTVGQWLILAYAILALIRRLDSRYSFGAALFLLVTVPLFSALGQSGIAQTVAIYVYEL